MSVVVIPEDLRWPICRRRYPDHIISNLSHQEISGLEVVFALVRRLMQSEHSTPYRRSLFYARYTDHVRACMSHQYTESDNAIVQALHCWHEGQQWTAMSPMLQERCLSLLLPPSWILRILILASGIQQAYNVLFMGLCPDDEDGCDGDDALRCTIEKVRTFYDYTNNDLEYLDDALVEHMEAQETTGNMEEEEATDHEVLDYQPQAPLAVPSDPLFDLPPCVTPERMFVYLYNTVCPHTSRIFAEAFSQHADSRVREAAALVSGESIPLVQHGHELMSCIFSDLPLHLKAQFLGYVGPESILRLM